MGAAHRWRTAALLIGGAALLGCGGGSGGGPPPASCLQFQPCGGDLVGTWRFAGACLAGIATLTADAQPLCSGAAVQSVSIGVTGSITFNADLTYTAQAWNVTFHEVLSEPLSCGTLATCAEGGGSIRDSNGSYLNETCSGTDICTCTASSLQVVTESGTYTTTGTQFDLTAPTSTRNRSYCVDGTELHIIEFSTRATDSSGQPLLLADSVAERQ